MSRSLHPELVALLREAFGRRIEALREVLAGLDPEDRLDDHLAPGSPAAVIDEAVALLDRRELLSDPETWRRWIAAAPVYVDDLLDLAARYCGDVGHLEPPRDQPLPELPFKDLDPYSEQDAQIFFGRRSSIQTILFVLRGAGPQVVLIFGATGVGKSSVLQAGVLPRAGAEFTALYVRHSASTSLLESLRRAFSGDDVLEAWGARERESRRPLMVVLDQIEAAYTGGGGEPQGERELRALLAALFGPEGGEMPVRGKLVLSVRKEWVTDVLGPLEARDVRVERIEVPRLDAESIREIVLGPTRRRLCQRYRLSFESGLAEQIAGDLLSDARSPIAPTLQMLLFQLWRECPVTGAGERAITRRQYDELGRKDQRFIQHIQQRLRGLAAVPGFRERVEAGLGLDLLFECTTPARTSRSLSGEELERRYGPDIGRLVDACVEARLLRREGEDERESTHVSLMHDTLAPVVRLLFRGSRLDGPRARRLFARFFEEGEEEVDLKEVPRVRPGDLDVLERGRVGMRLLTRPEQALIVENRRELDLEAARVERERRARRVLRYAIAGVTLVVVGSAAYSLLQRGYARELAAAQHVRELAVRGANANARGERAVGALLAARAYQDRTANNQTELSIIDATLRGALASRSLRASALVSPAGVRALAVSRDGGELLASALPSRLVALQSDGKGLELGAVTDDGGVAYGVAHHPRFGWAAAACDGAVRVWSGSIERPPRRLSVGADGPPRCLLAVAIDESGEHLLAGGSGGILYEWSVDGGPPVVRAELGATVNALAYGPGGWIAAGDEAGKLTFGRDGRWKAFDARRPIYALAWQDGAVVAGGDGDVMWELSPSDASGEIELRQRAHDLGRGTHSATLALVAVPGRRVATGHTDGAVRLWQVTSVDELEAVGTIDGHGWPVRALQYVAQDELLVAGSDDGMVRTYPWYMDGDVRLGVGLASRGGASGERSMRVIDGDGGVSFWRWDGGGRWLREDPDEGSDATDAAAVTSPDRRARVVLGDDVATVHSPEGVRTVALAGRPRVAAVDDLGRWFAVAFDAADIWLWSASGDAWVRVPTGVHDVISVLELSGDGAWLGIGGRTGDAALLRVIPTRAVQIPGLELDVGTGRVVGLAFFTGDESIAVLKDSGDVQVVPLTARLVRQACASFAGEVSSAEWQRVVAGSVSPPCPDLSVKDAPVVAPPLPAPARVVFAGCSELYDGPRCVVDPSRGLSFWVPPELGAVARVAVDGETELGADVELQRVQVSPSEGARSVSLIGADGQPLFELQLAEPAPTPERAAVERLRAAGRRFAGDSTAAAEVVAELERLASAAVASCDDASSASCRADTVFILAMRLIQRAADPGLALAWLDAHPLAVEMEATELGFDAAYARGTAWSALSGRAALDAADRLKRAVDHGMRLGLDYPAVGPAMQWYAATLYQMDRAEEALALYDEMIRASATGDACARALSYQHRADLRLKILRRGGRHDALSDFRTARTIYAAIPDGEARTRCFSPGIEAMLHADMALAACLQGELEVADAVRMRVAPAKVTSPETLRTLWEVGECLAARRAQHL